MELTTAGQPDDHAASISIDDLTLRFSRQDVDAAYERGAAEHVAELARVQALLDHAVQRSIMVVREAKDAHERGLAEGRAERCGTCHRARVIRRA